jgi:D-3-phosphoglycerate dehydrogenase
MQIIWYDPHVGEKIELNLYRTVDLKELLQKADHIILAASVLGTPRQILGPNEISEIKVGSGLVNISRGSLVDERAILRALNQRKLDYFAADVLQEEDFQYLENRPTSLRKELVAHENVIITPHIGGYSKDARERCDHHLATYLLEKGCKCDLLAGLRQI